MRSLKVYRDNYINGVKLKIGAWYKIILNEEVYDTKFWVVRFHSIEVHSIEGDRFNHMYDAYVIYSDDTMCDYSPSNGVYHPLCRVEEIEEIERVSLGWIKSLGINC
jgi:hypothetical protein